MLSLGRVTPSEGMPAERVIFAQVEVFYGLVT